MARAMEYVITALAFAAAAPLNPGPFTALIIAESLAGGWRRGVTAAFAPFITDGAMVVICLTALARLPATGLAAVQMVGGLVLIYLGYRTFQGARQGAAVEAAAGSSVKGGGWGPLWRGVAVNILNPSAWLFWLTAGTPTLRRAAAVNTGTGAAFLVTFFAGLVGGKVLLAIGTAGGGHLLRGRGYRIALAVVAVGLGLLGLEAIWVGVRAF